MTCVRGCLLQWGAVERSPGVYSWDGYKQLLQQVKEAGLKMQVSTGSTGRTRRVCARIWRITSPRCLSVQAVLSFHACGDNVGDTAQIQLPSWVLQVRQKGERQQVPA